MMTNIINDCKGLSSLTIIGPLAKSLPKALSSPTLFVDGAIKLRPKKPDMPCFAVGDGDSSNPDLMDKLLPPKKDVSDLGYLLQTLPPIPHVELWGFVGGRIDHQIAVWGEAHQYLLHSLGYISFDSGRSGYFFSGKKSHKVQVQEGFSLFSIEPNEFKIHGEVEYSVNQFMRINPLSSLGLSNTGFGSVELEARRPLLLIPSKLLF